MNQITHIGSLLKKIYRLYSLELQRILKLKGFSDLRPSFLELLLAIAEHEGASIKTIGTLCGLKKQTMTSHLNELERRDYIYKKTCEIDKREQRVYFTENGKKFKLALLDAINQLESIFLKRIGEIELDRIEMTLQEFSKRVEGSLQEQATLF